MKVIIDRFEGNVAVCEMESRTMVKIDINRLPSGVKEGYVLDIVGEDIVIDIEETQKKKLEIDELTDGLWK